MEFLQLIIAVLSLASLVVLFAMASNIYKIAASTKMSERILQRILEIIKEASNDEKAKQQMVYKNVFDRNKAKP